MDLFLSSKPRSLKEKRMIIRSLKQKIRNQFEVAVAEVGGIDLWQRCILGVACIGTGKREAESLIHKVIDFVDRAAEFELLNLDVRYY